MLVGSLRALTAENLVAASSAWRDAARITAPSLVIFGSHDRLVDPRLAGRAAHAFADARIVVLPRTGHVAHMEHPRAVAAEIGVLLATASAEAPWADAGIPARASRLIVARGGKHETSPVRIKEIFGDEPCRCPRWSSPPMS